jgi:hypothetical protein
MATQKERLFKVLSHDRMPYWGGSGQWPPPGEWLEVTGELVLCENGLHLCRERDLISWLGPEIWEAEYEGERLDGDDKIVVRKARLVSKLETWDERTQRLFACDCAERVLPLYEKQYPGDVRPRKATETARRFANGKATKEELAAAEAAVGSAVEAAWAAAEAAWAAWAAAWAAAEAAVGSAVEAAWAAAEAAWAAWAAAGSAVGSAVEAAWAARAAERKWQTARLMGYLYPKEG